MTARSVAPLLIASLAGLMTAAAVASPAQADAALRETSPKDGAVLAERPGEVRLGFNEDLQGRFTTVKVTASGGDEVRVAKAVTDGPTVRQPLPATLQPGLYTVAYRIVSADGHPVSGTMSFRVQAPSPSPSASVTVIPSTDTTTPSAAAEPDVQQDSGSTFWLWAVGGVVLTAVAGVLVVGRRRSSGSA